MIKDTIDDNIKLCECGCGQPTKLFRNKYNKFINGHVNKNKKINWPKKSNNHWNWKGGIKTIENYFYIKKPEHPKSSKDGYFAQHRLVYEEHHKCCLLPWIEIHHINSNRKDNRIENLQPMAKSEHMKIHNPVHYPDKRYCSLCNSIKTSLKKNGRPCWYRYENGYTCKKCYDKL